MIFGSIPMEDRQQTVPQRSFLAPRGGLLRGLSVLLVDLETIASRCDIVHPTTGRGGFLYRKVTELT